MMAAVHVCIRLDLHAGQSGQKAAQQTLYRMAPIGNAVPEVVQHRKTGYSSDGSALVKAAGHSQKGSSVDGSKSKGLLQWTFPLSFW